jgi:hypothetical protein
MNISEDQSVSRPLGLVDSPTCKVYFALVTHEALHSQVRRVAFTLRRRCQGLTPIYIVVSKAVD